MSTTETTATPDRAWWKEAVVYQIYPRSFNDSDGDGVGDIPGIIEKVDYLDSLGVDVVWLCPVYDSPQADNGYDISDYRSIAGEFGTMADWEELLSALHAREMRLIMDLVVNHTSDEHEWFQRSRKRDGKYEDYYIWRDSDGEGPPNNWESIFGGSAWSYDETRGQWYLHLFDEKQPDLNWRNPDVRADLKEMITWWLEKDIDGFRMDAINHISKTEGLPDGDPDSSIVGLDHYTHGPNVREYLQEVYDETLSNYDVVTAGEMGGTSAEQATEYLEEGGSGLDMIFLFDHLGVDVGSNGSWTADDWGEWDLTDLKEVVTHHQHKVAEPFWDAVFMGNHDNPRIVSRFGDDGAYREESAKLLATFMLTLRGTPYVYQGEEIGMTNAEFSSLEDLDDPMTVGIVGDLIESGAIDSYDDVRDVVNYRSRDHSRTPMQWSSGENAGFTDGDPWFDTNVNHTEVNVASALTTSGSIWHHYRRLIDLRHDEDVLVYGTYDLLLPDDEQFYAYARTLEDEQALVVLNWSDEPATFDAAVQTRGATALLGNYADPPTPPTGREFRPYEAVVYRL